MTAEKLAQMQSAAAAQRERLILESITDSFFAFDAGWRFTYLNDAARRGMAGHVDDPASLLGRNFFEVFPYNRGTPIEQAGLKAMSEGVMAEFEMLYEPWDRWYYGRCFPLQGGGLSVYFRETTQERQAAESLRASEAKYHSLFNSIDTGFCVIELLWDAQGRAADYRFVEVNPAFEGHAGLRDAVGKTIRGIHPEFEQGWIDRYGHVARTGQAGRFVEGSDVLGRWFDVYAFPMGTGQPRQVAVLFNDITARRRAEDELQAAKAALHELAEQRRLALDSAQMGWWHLDLLGDNRVHWDEGFKAVFGVSGQDLAYEKVISLLHPDDRGKVDAAVKAAIRPHDPIPYNIEYRVVHEDGSLHWVASRGQTSFEGEGEQRRAVGFVGTVLDITEAKTLRDALQRSEADFRQLADAMPQIVWSAGADRNINYYNERWYEYTGIPRDQFGQASWDGVIHPDDLARVVGLWVPAMAAGAPWEVEFRLRGAADGRYRWFLGRAVPIKDAAGKVVRWIGTDTDVHESRQLAERNADLLESERAARAEAERTGRMKDEFLATLSHELRTPLNAILGWTQVLRGDPANGEDVEAGLMTIERNARAQNQIIEDLLDMSKIVSGKVRLDVQPLELDQVIKSAVETMRPAADAKSIRIQALIDPEARMISGDPNRLQQVFWNLLSNAIKFTPKGGRVQVVLERIHSHLEVNVIDSGEGISPEFLPCVFDRFRQADASTTRQHGGLGLGLAIVKQLVELHGGSVHVDSPGLGQGAAFRVMLPLLAVQSFEVRPDAGRPLPLAGLLPPAVAVEALQLSGVRVLVVDDEADARALVKRLLEDRGARVRTAGSVVEAMELLRAETPEVLVSDIGMPEQDGYALIEQVRALPAGQGGGVPALALTAYARSEDRTKAVLAGYQTHLAKPVEAVELLVLVANLAGRAGRDAA